MTIALATTLAYSGWDWPTRCAVNYNSRDIERTSIKPCE